MRFHREVVQPELEEFRTEVRSRFDEMATKAELQAMRAEMVTMRAEMVTWPVLIRFQREVVGPELDEIRSRLDAMASRSELLSHVDSIYVRFDRLESEYHALTAAVRRLELQMAEQTADSVAVRSDLMRLNEHMSQLTKRIDSLEKALN